MANCFIATAAYGSPWESNVATLRAFRDRFLLQSFLGSCFVDFYYKNSPRLADAIRPHPWARFATRLALTPVVVVAGAFTGDPADLAVVGGAFILCALVARRVTRVRRRRRIALG